MPTRESGGFAIFMKKKNLQWFLSSLLLVITLTGCGNKASSDGESDANAKNDSDSTLVDEGLTPVKYSKENIKKYQDAYFEDNNLTKFTKPQLREIKAWAMEQIPGFIEETDKMLDAIDQYNINRTGEPYYPCGWGGDYNPAGIPEVHDWLMSTIKDDLNLGALLYLLKKNGMLEEYADKYSSKESYYVNRFINLINSCAPDMSWFLNTGMVCMHRGEIDIQKVKEIEEEWPIER